MRKIRSLYGPLLVVGFSLFVAGCQGVASSGGGGGPVASAPATPSASSPATPAPPAVKSSGSLAARAATTKEPPAPAGLKPYKNYSTTENLCAETCKSEARCESQTFKPIQEINGYIAGQCTFYGR